MIQTFESIPLLSIIPNNRENKYFFQNGLSKIIPRLSLKVESEIEICNYLWEEFSSDESLFDLWDVRTSWYEGYKFKPHFYTLYENSKPLAVLPIWYDTDEKRFEWFGSWWMEDNKFFVHDPEFIDLLIKIIPSPIFLNCIDFDENLQTLKNKRFFSQIQVDDPRNIKDISKFKNTDEYLATLSKKARYNLRADYKRIQALNPQVEIIEGKSDDSMIDLVNINKKRFDGAEDRDISDFFDHGAEDSIRNMISNQGRYSMKFIKVKIGGKLAGIDLVAQYKDIYYLINGGVDYTPDFRGISRYILFKEMEDAIKEGAKTVNCFQIDYGWKHRYFDQLPTHKLQI